MNVTFLMLSGLLISTALCQRAKAGGEDSSPSPQAALAPRLPSFTAPSIKQQPEYQAAMSTAATSAGELTHEVSESQSLKELITKSKEEAVRQRLLASNQTAVCENELLHLAVVRDSKTSEILKDRRCTGCGASVRELTQRYGAERAAKHIYDNSLPTHQAQPPADEGTRIQQAHIEYQQASARVRIRCEVTAAAMTEQAAAADQRANDATARRLQITKDAFRQVSMWLYAMRRCDRIFDEQWAAALIPIRERFAKGVDTIKQIGISYADAEVENPEGERARSLLLQREFIRDRLEKEVRAYENAKFTYKADLEQFRSDRQATYERLRDVYAMLEGAAPIFMQALPELKIAGVKLGDIPFSLETGPEGVKLSADLGLAGSVNLEVGLDKFSGESTVRLFLKSPVLDAQAGVEHSVGFDEEGGYHDTIQPFLKPPHFEQPYDTSSLSELLPDSALRDMPDTSKPLRP